MHPPSEALVRTSRVSWLRDLASAAEDFAVTSNFMQSGKTQPPLPPEMVEIKHSYSTDPMLKEDVEVVKMNFVDSETILLLIFS